VTNEASVLMGTPNRALDADAALQELGTDLIRRSLCRRDRHGLGRIASAIITASFFSLAAVERFCLRPLEIASAQACIFAKTGFHFFAARSKRRRPAIRAGDAPVAQLDRALPSEGRGHRFESCRARHFRTEL
jgi:hypothetical protein